MKKRFPISLFMVILTVILFIAAWSIGGRSSDPVVSGICAYLSAVSFFAGIGFLAVFISGISGSGKSPYFVFAIAVVILFFLLSSAAGYNLMVRQDEASHSSGGLMLVYTVITTFVFLGLDILFWKLSRRKSQKQG